MRTHTTRRNPAPTRSCRTTISAAQPKQRSTQMPSHTSSAFPREVDRRADNALRSTPASAESQHRGTREPFQFGTGTTPDERSGHGRLAEARRPLAREADRRAAARGRALTRTGCSPQTYETRVVSHAGTETHTPNHCGLGSLPSQQLTQPEDTTRVLRVLRARHGRGSGRGPRAGDSVSGRHTDGPGRRTIWRPWGRTASASGWDARRVGSLWAGEGWGAGWARP